ncbi:uncharacterized protein ColSpa_09034 [Colletotrichum spaethianum]|uniref:Uncharacterized protein n=1 Tax=Colletotrichum spaethianum TaxID=700344 RepID=A0AA37PAV5_9PEZI|nr:uncharacterized protein ColSpa_09034 [Colletotrichum spaethianum]GKT48853.1 hypothetical protein ColSpa_09034 [Colletotrichum spaethianum]
MPSFRGLDVSVVPRPDAENFVELPHPESSYVHLRGPHPVSPTTSLSSSFVSTPEKFKPTTSVYIPSSLGAQFHLRYSINRPPPDTKYLYFRVTMNGRQTVSWGIKSCAIQNQIVSYALYEPDSKWQYRESGVVYKRDGVEKRFFHFAPRFEASAALDGGLIDLQVFRSKGRRRRAPELNDFRSQDGYGITSPTGGLVELPQELTFYDWVLIDPVDSPFATFRFFYRSWENLKALNLVSVSHYEALVATSKRQGKLLPTRPKTPAPTNDSKDLHENGLFCFGSLDESVFQEDGMGIDESKKKQKFHSTQRAFYLATPPKLTPIRSAWEKWPQPSKMMRDIRQPSDPLRLLPVLPDFEPSLRRASLESTRAPSVTPSLLPYVEESSGGDELEIGIARQVVLPSMSRELGKTLSRPLPSPPQIQLSSSDYDMTPPSTGGMGKFKRVGRQEYIAAADTTAENLENRSISEGKWLKRSPSPLRRKQGSLNLNEWGWTSNHESRR